MMTGFAYPSVSNGHQVARVGGIHHDSYSNDKQDCGMPPPNRQPQVLEYAERLEKTIAENEHLVRTMSERLACLIAPIPCGTGGDENKACPAMAPFAANLAAFVDRLESANSQLRYLLGAIEV